MSRILYLHGFASGISSSKARFFQARLPDVDILSMDGGDFEHLTITAQLEIVRRAAAGDRVSLVGSSMGAWVAGLFAARHPEVDRVVMLAPAVGFNRRWPERLGPAEMDRWRREGALEVFHYGENRTRRIGYQLIEDAANYEDFPTFPQPALVFHGVHDDIVPVDYARRFAAGRSNLTLEELDSGHDLLNVLDYVGDRAAEFLLQ